MFPYPKATKSLASTRNGRTLSKSLFIPLSIFLTAPLTSFAEKMEMNFLVWEGYLPKEAQDEFKKVAKAKHSVDLDIKVDFIVDENQLFSGTRSKKYHVISPTIDIIRDERFNFIKNGLVIEVDLKNIPNYSSMAKEWQKPEHLSEKGKVYGTSFHSGPYGIIYNKAVFASDPGTYAVLTDPKYKGKTAIGNLPNYNVYVAALIAGAKGNDIFDYEKVTKQPGFRDALEKMYANKGLEWQGVEKAEELEPLSAATAWTFALPGLAAKGKQWTVSLTKEGQIGWADSMMCTWAVTTPKQKAVCEEFLNFTISKDYQTKYVVKGLSTEPVRDDVIPAMSAADLKGLEHLKRIAEFRKIRIYVKPLTRRNRNGFETIYKEVEKLSAKK
jgi:spermidine/putrescine-binding protein